MGRLDPCLSSDVLSCKPFHFSVQVHRLPWPPNGFLCCIPTVTAFVCPNRPPFALSWWP
jgi:hypothetical protein